MQADEHSAPSFPRRLASISGIGTSACNGAPPSRGGRCGAQFRLPWRLASSFARRPSRRLANGSPTRKRAARSGTAAIHRRGCALERAVQGRFRRWQGRSRDWLRGGSQYERDEGLWRAGRQTGEGAQTWPGGQYKGQFSESLPHGKGVLSSGEARYDGAFLNGKPNGKGALTNASGRFDGTWSDGCFNDGKRRATLGVSVQSCP